MHILSPTKFEKREITFPIPIICRGWPGAFAETSPDLITYIASGSSPVYSQIETHSDNTDKNVCCTWWNWVWNQWRFHQNERYERFLKFYSCESAIHTGITVPIMCWEKKPERALQCLIYRTNWTHSHSLTHTYKVCTCLRDLTSSHAVDTLEFKTNVHPYIVIAHFEERYTVYHILK